MVHLQMGRALADHPEEMAKPEFGRTVVRGAEQPYNCSTVDLFEKWEDIDNEMGSDAWEALHVLCSLYSTTGITLNNRKSAGLSKLYW